MKSTFQRFLVALLLLVSVRATHAELLVASNATFARFCSSYFTLNCAGCYIDAGRYLYWPKKNIHCYDNSESGLGLEGQNETRLEKMGIAEWANGDDWFGEFWADNNGGYNTNTFIANLTNMLNAPGLFYNGSMYTNEQGWAAAHAGQIKWIIGGAIPFASGYLRASTEEELNNAATNAAAQLAYTGFDVFHPLNFTYGWSNDIQTTANLRQLSSTLHDGEHPGPPGALDMALVELTSQIDTNINTAILNFGAATVSDTNHVVVSSVALSGTTLTFNWRADRHSAAWDKPNATTGITNDASLGFALNAALPTQNAALSNSFHEDIVLTNIPNGNYRMIMDGVGLGAFTASGGRLVVNLFGVTTGPLWNQRVEVLRLVRIKRYCDPITLVFGSAGDGQGEVSYQSNANGFWDLGHRGDTLVSDLSAKITNLNSKDAAIWAAATPTNHTFEMSLIIPRAAPFHR